MSGLAQFIAARDLGTLQEWCEEGYQAVSRIDEELSGKGAEMVLVFALYVTPYFARALWFTPPVDYSQRYDKLPRAVTLVIL